MAARGKQRRCCAAPVEDGGRGELRRCCAAPVEDGGRGAHHDVAVRRQRTEKISWEADTDTTPSRPDRPRGLATPKTFETGLAPTEWRHVSSPPVTPIPRGIRREWGPQDERACEGEPHGETQGRVRLRGGPLGDVHPAEVWCGGGVSPRASAVKPPRSLRSAPPTSSERWPRASPAWCPCADEATQRRRTAENVFGAERTFRSWVCSRSDRLSGRPASCLYRSSALSTSCA